MDIYIGNIPKGTRPGELKKLLKERIKHCVFERVYQQAVALGRFDQNIKVEIRKQKYFNRKGHYRFGHICVYSDRIGQVALDSLKNAEIRGSTIHAREFILRNENNDRRLASSDHQSHNGISRRAKDRRIKQI